MVKNVFLAKCNGLELGLHSKSVSVICALLCKSYFKDHDFLKNNIMYIVLSGLMHDIGKVSQKFQKYLKTGEKSDIYHHELSWAICVCLFQGLGFENMLNSIYWHHAKREKNNKANNLHEILNDMSEVDMVNIHSVYIRLIAILKDVFILCNVKYDESLLQIVSFEEFKKRIETAKNNSGMQTPKYYTDSANICNRNYIVYRSILMCGDRLSSKLSTDDVVRSCNDLDFCKELIKNDKQQTCYVKPDAYEKERFDLQCEISDICNQDKTFVVKAPAGFGKTIIGLLWSLKRTNKLIWVCPRNIVVESVYDSIVEEFKSANINNISVELFITGERKICTNNEIEEFNSDIVVTNIDNFLYPISKNKFGIFAFEIMKRDVVFDEFHEFVSDSALFSGFVSIMKIRHNIIKSSTVLLSATPSLFSFLWDTIGNETVILPNDEEHYPPAHSKKYVVNFIDESELESRKNSVIITNSIFNAQIKKRDLKSDILIHSDYIEEHRKEKLQIIFDNYKKNPICNEKPSVVSSTFLQASMNISFRNMCKSVTSPESDIQSIGRTCRFGEYDDSNISFFNITLEDRSKSEKKAIEILYDIPLNNIWNQFLKEQVQLFKNKLSIKDLYYIYNLFNKINCIKIQEFINSKYIQSLEHISKIEPKHVVYEQKSNGKGQGKGGGEETITMRTCARYLFVVYENYDLKGQFTDPFSINIPPNITESSYFGEDDVFSNKLQKTINNFVQEGKYKYPKSFKKNLRRDVLLKWAKWKHTPYVAFNKKYSKEFGLAKNSIYNV